MTRLGGFSRIYFLAGGRRWRTIRIGHLFRWRASTGSLKMGVEGTKARRSPPIAESEGLSTHVKISSAAPIRVGFLMDYSAVILTDRQAVSDPSNSVSRRVTRESDRPSR